MMVKCILHKVILLLVFLVKLILIHGAEIMITTPNTRDYTFLSNHGIPASDRLLNFQVKACSNAYVGLMSGSSEADPLYEIDFGGQSNTVSFIRARKSNTLPHLDEVTGPILHCNIYEDFRITWDYATISVYHGLGDSGSSFLTWTSPTTLWPIQNIGISTAFGATGGWIFHIQEPKTIESTNDLPTTATPESKSTDRQVSFDATSLLQATSIEYLQTNTTMIQYNNEEATTTADRNQTSNLQLKNPEVSTSTLEKTKCSQSHKCICQKRMDNLTENQDIYITKVSDYIWLKRCVLQPMIDSGMVKVSDCPYQCSCSPKGGTAPQEYDNYACVKRP